jgi:hypothetical protein
MVVLCQFAPVFSERIWDWAQVLVMGAILAPGRRTVASILRVMGLGQERQFQNYHRVLNRARWSGQAVSERLLRLLLAAFVPAEAALVLGADETLERRRGAKIAGLGCFRDAARSTAKNKVKSMGLRWVSMMLLVHVPWNQRVWALPFLTVLAPNRASNQAGGKRHKTSLDWIEQMTSQVRRWLPGRRLVLVVDGGLAALKLALSCQHYREPITYVTRLQLNARLFDLPPERKAGQRGRQRIVGERQVKAADRLNAPASDWQNGEVVWYDGQGRSVRFQSQLALWYTCGKPPVLGRWVLLHAPAHKHLKACLLFATDPNATPEQIITWFIMRWSIEVTFEEVRAHLGFETQRQWNPLAVARSSPALLGLFSLVTLLAQHLSASSGLSHRSTAWYTKPEATFSDCIALVRTTLWTQTQFPTARCSPRSVNIPLSLLDTWLEALAYPA